MHYNSHTMIAVHRYTIIVLLVVIQPCMYAASHYPVAFKPQDSENGVSTDTTYSDSILVQPLNSFGFSGNLYTSTVWTLGGPEGDVPLFSASYTRTIFPNVALSLQLRYMSVFLDRSNSFTPGLRLRWLNSIWGTDLLVIFYPWKSVLPNLRIGIGPSLDIASTFQTRYAGTHPNSDTITLRAARNFTTQYLGGIVCIDYKFLSLAHSVEMGMHLQVYVQQSLTPRPYFPTNFPYSGGVVYGIYVRANW